MIIKKFDESSKYDDIEEIILDFKDDGFEVKTIYLKNLIVIKGHTFQKMNKLEFLQNIINTVKRIKSIGYVPIYDDLNVHTGFLDGKPICNFTLRFNDLE
jgi:hypothetical protein